MYTTMSGGPAYVCGHVPISGEPCGRRCYNPGACWAHRKVAPSFPCLRGCGRRTRSFTRYCAHCGGYQTNALAKARKGVREMDAYVTALVEGWPVPEPEPRVSPAPSD